MRKTIAYLDYLDPQDKAGDYIFIALQRDSEADKYYLTAYGADWRGNLQSETIELSEFFAMTIKQIMENAR